MSTAHQTTRDTFLQRLLVLTRTFHEPYQAEWSLAVRWKVEGHTVLRMNARWIYLGIY